MIASPLKDNIIISERDINLIDTNGKQVKIKSGEVCTISAIFSLHNYYLSEDVCPVVIMLKEYPNVFIPLDAIIYFVDNYEWSESEILNFFDPEDPINDRYKK